jgi:predicted negative regulator of RcsB-dependent stress response
MELNLNNLKDKLNLAGWFRAAGDFLNRKSRWIIAVVFLVVLGYCAWLWYSNVINPRWSEDRKQAYISTKQNAAAFNQSRFGAVTSAVENRQAEYQKSLEPVTDIFHLQQ